MTTQPSIQSQIEEAEAILTRGGFEKLDDPYEGTDIHVASAGMGLHLANLAGDDDQIRPMAAYTRPSGPDRHYLVSVLSINDGFYVMRCECGKGWHDFPVAGTLDGFIQTCGQGRAPLDFFDALPRDSLGLFIQPSPKNLTL